MKNIPIAEKKFIVHKLTDAETEALRVRNAREREEAELRLEQRAEGELTHETLAEINQRLSDWLLINEGRHLNDRQERKAYRATAATVGKVEVSGDMPAIETTLETAITGGLEDN